MSTNVVSPESPPRSRRGWALALIAAAQFMVIMDTSIIGVALPRIQQDIGISQENLSWIFNAYVVAFGGLLLLGGRLADLFGARRVFSAGWLVLLVGSGVAGAAGTLPVELIGRALQGVGAALIAPSALSLLMMLFGSDPRQLTRALALYGAAARAGGTAGVFLGGVITEYASWPWVFFLNVPIAVVALLAVPALMPSSPTAARRSVDLLGALTVTAGLTAGVFAIVRAATVGWASTQVWGPLIGAVLLLTAFVAIQRSSREPLVRLSIFRTRDLAPANVVQLLLGAAWIPMWFFLNLYLQQVLGYSAFPSGLALLPMTLLIMIGMIALAPAAINRFGAKAMTVAGLVLLTAGMALLAAIRPDGTFWIDVLPGSLVAALGMSLAFIPSLGTAISSAPPEQGGLAAGIVNTSYQVGSALGLAVTTAVAAELGADRPGDVSALTEGFSAAFIGAAVVAAAAAVAAAALAGRTRREPPSPVPDDQGPS
ncbi:drug resistance transporter, EmrB/QacA subfamily [Geodermatophilus africanus]|uniref:Drug resistance transporter, EmrB/QacA subfamily n=1 Tax=Geodermatophilus africanus TaxID=1137993 RepID=A0A1H3ACQ2_9ACTN|nr:MFS transporter [Geodermatophilus africanus]SDX27446.1 drug resistance transporter, EmrB/QacA subfamily [Geodermatophilus africanus]